MEQMEQMEQLIGPIQERWLQSLEQHPERKTTGRLGFLVDGSESEYKACCLGELGIIAGTCYFKEGVLIDEDGSGGTLRGSAKKLGLYCSAGTGMNHAICLSSLNDNGSTWPEIAAIVRANPRVYLSKPV